MVLEDSVDFLTSRIGFADAKWGANDAVNVALCPTRALRERWLLGRIQECDLSTYHRELIGFPGSPKSLAHLRTMR
jgi:hypothetical protein